MIVVEPSSGLCSRIYVLCDAYELAKQSKQKLIILWTQTADCNCRYSDIFEKSQFDDIECKVISFVQFSCKLKNKANFISFSGLLCFIREVILRFRFLFTYYPAKVYYKLSCSYHKNSYKDGNAIPDINKIIHNNSYIEAYCGITQNNDISSIRFISQAWTDANRIMSSASKQCIGVHIRRTDHEPAKNTSSTEQFISLMKKLKEQDISISFFLATDDWNEQSRIIEIFGDCIITQNDKTLNRSSKEGMYSSLIDCLCLSKTQFILGSYSSVFSNFSARLGNIELKIVQ